MKIVFFGDSLTQGSYGTSYVNKVAAAMRGHHFINEGVNGDTSLNLYRRVDCDVINHQPDGVLMMIGINDAVSYSEPGTRLYYRYFKKVRGGQITPVAFRENVRATITKLRFAQIKTWVVLPPVEYRPAVVSVLREMNDLAAEVCREQSVPTLDLMALLTPPAVPDRPSLNIIKMGLQRFRRRKATGYTYTFDGLHLTEAGAQRVADEITSFLRMNGVHR